MLHLATETNTSLVNPSASAYFQSSVDGTRRVLDLALETGAERMLFTSSGAVYGPRVADFSPVSEEELIAPAPEDTAAAYGEGKRAAEFLCAAAWEERGLITTVARCFAFVGPRLPLASGFAIGNFIGDALSGDPIRVQGDGSAVRSYLYASDLALWLWTILLHGQAARPYNVGSEQAITIRELATTVARVVGGAKGVDVAGVALPGTPRSRYVPDT